MKIVVPIMPTSLEEAQALELSRFEGADIIEWRADFLDKDSILTVAPAIFEKFAGFEIVFTIRTTREGGRLELTDAEYVAQNKVSGVEVRQNSQGVTGELTVHLKDGEYRTLDVSDVT